MQKKPVTKSNIPSALKKVGIEEIYLSTIKATYDKPIVNFILRKKKLKQFALNLGTRQGHSSHSCSV